MSEWWDDPRCWTPNRAKQHLDRLEARLNEAKAEAIIAQTLIALRLSATKCALNLTKEYQRGYDHGYDDGYTSGLVKNDGGPYPNHGTPEDSYRPPDEVDG